MNYLAHAFLSFGDSELLTGNMIADFVKGKHVLNQFPEKIKEGILLHREIDCFTDEHYASKKAAQIFRKDYGRYAPAIVDSLFDHFLANDTNQFATEESLFDFSQTTYDNLALHEEHFPKQFAGFFPHMKIHNWLFNYRSHEGMKRSLTGLYRRAQYMPSPEKAFDLFIENYSPLNDQYELLMPEMISFVLEKINKPA